LAEELTWKRHQSCLDGGFWHPTWNSYRT
jgi:hypothetical protein